MKLTKRQQEIICRLVENEFSDALDYASLDDSYIDELDVLRVILESKNDIEINVGEDDDLD